jgi:thiol-disulfide isomerase/thioredoxin
MKRIIFAIIIFTVLCSCTHKANKVVNVPEKGDVVLILDSMPVNYKFYYGNDGGYCSIGGRSALRYNLNSMISVSLHNDYSKNKDTIVIKDVEALLEIEHKYRGLDAFSFLARPNDTLYFSYKGKMPVVSSSRKSKKYDYAYEEFVRKNVYENDYSAYIKYYLPCFLRSDHKQINVKSLMPVREQVDMLDSLHHIKYHPLIVSQLKKEEQLLDSLILNENISKDIAFLYKQRIKYKRLEFQMKENNSIVFKDLEQNDTLLKYEFYRYIIFVIAGDEIYSKVKSVKHSNGWNRDPIKIYKLIQENSFLSDGTRKFLSYECFKNILELSSNKKIKEYFEIFKFKFGKDTCLINHLVKEYKLGDEVSSDLNLLTDAGTKTTFKEVLEKNKGKLVYVDFWASWCAPCRRCMPASHKLREEFKGKDVVFVYLAFKDKLRLWKKAIEQLDLKDYNDSYFIENSKSSKLIDDLKVRLIPRFLIYGKNGEILYKNAARPATKEIRDILNKLF